MGIFALLTILSGLMMGLATSSEDEPVTPEEPDTPAEPDTPEVDPDADTGATFDYTEDGVTLDIGDDETGSLVVFYYTDYEDHPTDPLQVDQARFYLVPEGVDWSSASYETRSDVPGLDEFDGSRHEYELAEFEAQFGLELLGVVDLIDVPRDTENPADRVGGITANGPVTGYFVGAQTDGDEIIRFLPEDYVVTRDGVAEVSVTEDTTGTDATDWLSTDADGITLDGAGGNDYLDSDNSNVTLIGGQGDDTIVYRGTDVVVNGGDGDDYITAMRYSSADGVGIGTVDGGAGEDRIYMGSGTAHGGEGDDDLSDIPNDDGPSMLYGDAGNDSLNVTALGSQAFGGVGDDVISVGNGTVGYGDEGNDVLRLSAGATAFGGVGDDLFTFVDFLHNENGSAVATGGEGADIYDLHVRSAVNGEADEPFLTITDFDPAEDVLQVRGWGTSDVDTIEIVEAADGSYTDVRVTYTNTSGLPAGISVVHLLGTTGITVDQIVITD